MKSYGSTFVTFPSHLAQREETCQKSLHQRQNTPTYKCIIGLIHVRSQKVLIYVQFSKNVIPCAFAYKRVVEKFE